MKSFEVIYLTGPPATGKTTLVNRIKAAFPDVRTIVYSEILAMHITKRIARAVSQEHLRKTSSRIVSPSDIAAVDKYLVREVSKSRRSNHVVVDSHAVTKEGYGFRVTAFSLPLLHDIRPTRICMLFADSSAIRRRVKRDPKGRPMISAFESDFHCFAQAGVAIAYGIIVGVPVYFYDSAPDIQQAFEEITKRLIVAG